jgi:hypothetical protein
MFELPLRQRIRLAPAHFWGLLDIGRGQLSFATRLRVALKLTWILLWP